MGINYQRMGGLDTMDTNQAFHSMSEGARRRWISVTERKLLNNEPLDDPIDSIPHEFMKSSPLLLSALGAHLAEHGKLPEARETIRQALRGYTEITLQKQMVAAMAQLAMLDMQLGHLQDAKELLTFLHAIWQRGDEELTGHVTHALGRGAPLLDLKADAQLFYEQAITAYEKDGLPSLAWEAWFDKLTKGGSGLSEPAWNGALQAFQHYLQAHRGPMALYYLAQAHRAAAKEDWNQVEDVLAKLKTSTLRTTPAKWALLLEFKAQITRNRPHAEATLATLEGEDTDHEMDIEIRMEWLLLKTEWYCSKKQWHSAEVGLAAAQALVHAVPSPDYPQRIASLDQQLRLRDQAPATPADVQWKVYCFSELRFVRHGEEVKDIRWKRKKTKELFIYLMLSPQYAAHREKAADDLFDDIEAAKQANQMYVVIHQLKQTLKEYLGVEDAVSSKDGIIRLNEHCFEYVDVEHYLALVRVGSQLWATDKDVAIGMLEKAANLYGEPLPDMLYRDWLDRIKSHLMEQQSLCLQRLALHAIDLGDNEQAEQYLMDWITLNPLEEEAYQHLLSLLIRQGRHAEAEKWFRRLDALCQEELGISPLPATKRILERRTQ